MKKSGLVSLPLHGGNAPQWLVGRMIRLAKGIVAVIVNEYGNDTLIQRISDPFWFQALGCVLGYDWHSSGVTTVLTGVLKSAIRNENLGLAVCGGKGKASRRAISEIMTAGDGFGLSSTKISGLQYASRMSAKIDNTAIQAGYPLYHHAFFMTENGKWAVVQQGMNASDKTARRYHWVSDRVKRLVVEPHSAIVGDAKRQVALDMTALESEACRRISVDIAKENPRKVVRMLRSIRINSQSSLQQWLPFKSEENYVTDFLDMPIAANWRTLRRIYEFHPADFEELLSIRGVGPTTVRGLALISEIIYGERASWKDPVKYSFAYGGKDGVPFPVDRNAMDESILVLKDAVDKARLDQKQKLDSLRRLRLFVPPNRCC